MASPTPHATHRAGPPEHRFASRHRNPYPRDHMNFCNQCGARVELRIPPGDHIARHVCDACGTIHYQNPRLIVGCVPEYEGRILLCRRAIEPRRGYWTVPAGFME